MLIESLKVKGIGPYVNEVELNPIELEALVAIVAPNGIGKTFLLECIPGALYAYFPFRMFKQKGISIYDMVTPNQESYIEMVFTVAGRRFRIIRNFTRKITYSGGEEKPGTQNHTAFIYETVDGEWVARADKVAAVGAYVEQHVCAKSIFLSAMFNSQNSAGDLVTKTADERKEVFASIIGLGGLAEKSELFKARAALVEKEVERFRVLVEAENSKLKNVPSLEGEISRLNESLKSIGSIIELSNTNRDNLLREKAEHDQTAEKHQEKFDAKKEDENERDDKIARLGELKNLAATSGGIDRKIKELEKKKKRYEFLESVYKEWNTLKDQITDLDKEWGSLNNRVRDEITKRKEDKATLKDKVNGLKLKIKDEQKKHEEIERKEKECEILLELDCPQNCEYVANAREAKQWIELNDTRSDIASNIEAIKTEIEETEDEIKNFDKQFSSEHFCRTERFRIKEIEKQQAELKAERDEKGKILDEVKPTKERIKVLEEADLHTKAGEIKSAAKQIPEIEDDIKNLTAKIQKAESELSDISLEVKDFDGLIRRHDQTIKEETAKRENALREIERYKTDIKNTKQGKFQISVLNGKQARHERLQEKYLQLSDAFSRNGIQALIIDSEKLTFIEIAKGLFQILSGGRMALHFSTQKTLKNQKEVREDFELQLTIDGVTRPLNQASQGQQDLGKIVMRATLGIYFAQKNGSRIQTYCLDETTGALDEINRESYYDFLKYLLNYFEQIFVITHQDIAKSIACQVRINDDRKIEITV